MEKIKLVMTRNKDVRRLKDDRGEGIDTVYFVKKEENDR